MDELNREEIERLRERLHTYGNSLQEHIGNLSRVEGKMQDINEKLDAIHTSLKEDLSEIKGKQDQTNGRVTGQERRVAKIEGLGIAFAAGTPFVLFALTKLAG